MSTAETTPEASHEAATTIDESSSVWTRIDKLLERGGELLNPILVKEARQSLKSRQFVITFSLLMICGWSWSVIGIAVMYPAVYYAATGPYMLIGYYLVLAIPLLVSTPFAAFRSLAGEREDGTFELLSITSLNARQIIMGKLGSAVLQMIVYYSALAPCIAFTYMLRGVDVLTILFVLVWTFLVSLLLSVLSLMAASITHSRQWQVFLSVVLIIGLLFVGFIWTYFIIGSIVETSFLALDSADFWVGNFCVFTAYLSFFFLFLLAAAAQISFESDNRSTRLRVVMLAQQLLIVGWCMYYWMRSGEEALLIVLPILAGIHWAVMGALLSGETAQLSPRVLRSLPQSFLGRMMLTWFNPGSGTGFSFAIVNLTSVVLLVFVAGLISQLVAFRGAPSALGVYWFAIMLLAYTVAYLGVARLLIVLMKRYMHLGLALPFLLSVLLVIAGAAVPALISFWIHGYSTPSYTSLQVTNWFWTLAEAAEFGMWVEPLVPVTVIGFAAIVFLGNLVLTAREVELVRQEAPARVVADEMELHPEKFAQPKVVKSPWDEDESTAGEPAV